MTTARLTQLPDDELGRTIRSLHVRWPPTPDVTASVLRDVARGRRPRRRLSRTTAVIIIAATILAIAAAAAAAKFALDLGGIAIRSVPTIPTLPASPVEPAVIGDRTTLEEAADVLGEPLPIPPSLGAPDVVWLRRGITSFEPTQRGVVVAMAWRPTPGLPRIPGSPFGATLFVFRADQIVAVKSLEVPFEQLRTHGALWSDSPHQLDLYVDGRIRSFRVSGTVLIWQDGDLALRFESTLGRRAATSLAFGGT